MSETPENQPPCCEESRSVSFDAPNDEESVEQDPSDANRIALPAHVAGSGTLDRLLNTARDYAKASTAKNSNKAHAANWKHFARWCRQTVSRTAASF